MSVSVVLCISSSPGPLSACMIRSCSVLSRRFGVGLINKRKRYRKKNIKLQPVPPSMPSEALSVLFWDTHSASSGIDGGTGCNCIFFYTRVHTIEAY